MCLLALNWRGCCAGRSRDSSFHFLKGCRKTYVGYESRDLLLVISGEVAGTGNFSWTATGGAGSEAPAELLG